ncbi:acetyl-CoA hydrolase/transferase C-terminal domain-containing protein [Wenzhouxiangella marina]|uniref:acetyl-CoA hydrolase/transferase C-terminal domain-containing protein n=1 Tax=Wenzhouxiangella marina TaxID=1579979 RepID=UPI0017C65349|nr:acetyl-CoA hydrolase/transferase C-terminal domain-containing protein [Wenzhouxiangella marina]MBB6086882.1 acyl-CoA hydrolase [Wenzhouxiangella marina]
MVNELGQDAGLDAVVERTIERVGRHLVLGLPLGLGKPNRLVNAFYRRARLDPDIRLDIVTALSLDPPRAGHWLEARLMDPIVERLFGSAYPRLDYIDAQRRNALPPNITVTEFYVSSGAALGKPTMQRHYISSNYTHVARDLVDRGINVIAQLVAGPVDGRYSLSSNPDVSLDLKRRLAAEPGRTTWTIAQVHPELPFMHGDARVESDFFDEICEIDPEQPLFGLPRLPVSPQDHAVGFQASRLVADGGTLQIGIGSLSDALVHSLIERHQDNETWQARVARVAHGPSAIEAASSFEEGLYGASEMFMDGFMHLYRAGILKRGVVDDLEAMRRINAGTESAPDDGVLMDGGFFLGSQDFYAFLRDLDERERPRFRMHGVGRINQLYGGLEMLEIEQRRHARFINTCMMMTATGAAVSDGLQDHQVVSGVGGQYNFVAMAHAMDDGRSILMLRATRESGGRTTSNIVWEYPHVTIPRHLRDIVVTEYGVADLRGKTDEECIQAMVGIMDARFQDALVERARSAGKLDPNWSVPDAYRANLPARIEAEFKPGECFPAYPFGSDFTELEQRLIPALQSLKAMAGSKLALLGALWRGQPGRHREALERLGLDSPASLGERAYARLLAAVLDEAG